MQCKQVFTSLSKRVIRKWSEWSKRDSACSQPLNKKLVEASCAKRVFTSLDIKLLDWSLTVVSQVWMKSLKVSSAKRMFTSLNKKLVKWSTHSFACSQSLNSRVSFRERWEAAVFAGYKVGEEIVDKAGVAVLRFSYCDLRFLKQITKLVRERRIKIIKIS